jgi:two-component system response regulator YesN
MNKSFNYLSLTEIDIYDTILKLNTIQEMRLYFENFYNSILKYSEEQRKVKNKEIVKAIIEYIDDNLHSDLCVDKLSDVFFISSSHIRKIVKEEIGMTIKEYIDGQRIMKAKSFLESTNDTVTKISEKVGYSSIQAFTRAFKLHTGKTPSDYRTGSILKTK